MWHFFSNFTANNEFKMKKLFLLDAYALIFRSYYALIRAPRINSKGLNTSAIMGFVNTLNEIITKENPDYLGVAFDLDKTFRHEAFPAYKAQRDATPEDIKLSVPYIKDILRAFNIPILEASGFEADDVIGTLAVKAGAEGIETYMLTPDKDYGQLVRENVFMYRPRHGGGYEILGTKEIAEKYDLIVVSDDIYTAFSYQNPFVPFASLPGMKDRTIIINSFSDIKITFDVTGENIKPNACFDNIIAQFSVTY